MLKIAKDKEKETKKVDKEKKPKDAKKKDKDAKKKGKGGKDTLTLWGLPNGLDEKNFPLADAFVSRCLQWLRAHKCTCYVIFPFDFMVERLFGHRILRAEENHLRISSSTSSALASSAPSSSPRHFIAVNSIIIFHVISRMWQRRRLAIGGKHLEDAFAPPPSSSRLIILALCLPFSIIFHPHEW